MSWFYWALPAVLFLYGVFQRVAPSVLVSDLMREFVISGATIGNISAFYYYAYASVQVPAGLLIDRYGPRCTLGAAALLCAIGTHIFCSADSSFDLFFGRLLIGLGAGFSFVGTLKVIGIWFSPFQFSYLSGLTMALGMVGGVLGQAPLATLVSQFGWRYIMNAAGFLILALSLVILIFMKNPGSENSANNFKRGIWDNLILVIFTPQIWIIAVTGGGMAAIITAFVGLWGVPFLMEAKQISKPMAAALISFVLLGSAIGAPLAGWVADHIRRCKPVILIGTSLMLFNLSLIIFIDLTVSVGFYILLFFLGLTLGCVIVIYTVARQHSPSGAEGTTISFVNMIAMSSGGLFQPLIGWLLDLKWNGELLSGYRIYTIEGYREAFIPLVVISLCAIIFGALIDERRPEH